MRLVFILGLFTAATVFAQQTFVDDSAIMKQLEDGVAALIKAEKMGDPQALQKQLVEHDRANTRATLFRTPVATNQLERAAFYKDFRPRLGILAEVRKGRGASKWDFVVGAAFPLTADGIFATTYHGLSEEAGKPCRGVVVMMPDGGIHPVTNVLAAAKAVDCAIVQVAAGDTVFVPLPLAPDPDITSNVRLIHGPNRRFSTYHEGLVTRFYLKERHGKKVPRMSTSVAHSSGSSGSPMFDERGNVVGMICGNVYFTYARKSDRSPLTEMVLRECVPSSSIQKLLKTAGE